MRPRGEVREALRSAFDQLGPMTLRSALPALPVCPESPAERAIVRRTVTNMVHAGELVRCGTERAAGSGRWMAIYEVSSPSGMPARQSWVGIEEVASVVSLWRAAG